MTLMFWLIASSMTLCVIALLVWPLLRRTTAIAMGERENKLEVYRQQFAELEQDRKNGVLNEDLYQQARRELERRLLDETGDADTTPATARWQVNRRLVAAILAIIIPTVSVALYWKLGNPLAMTHPSASSLSAQGNQDPDHLSAQGIEALSERLKKKLEQNPNDGVGWALLARSYVEMGRYRDAVAIYEKAMMLIPDDAQLLADYADALGVLHGRTLEGKPELLIQQALKSDPQNVKALMLAGTVAFDRKKYAEAARYWDLARMNLPPDADPEVVQELASAIGEAKNLAGEKGKAATANAELAGSAKATGQTGQSLAISGKVSLAPHLASKGSPTDTLFVFARAMEGPPMPVAIMRVMKKDLPFTFRLDDSNSPMPARKLSEAGTVVIVARLSKSGEAMPKSGDLQGMSQPVKPGVNGITVVIDREIP
ncbi:MAG: c-type cytochrome biogenesis protein CcmI [Nitrospirae bacterium]|nr:c-type cytochrome biogenesis protein CcmI [Nitrospirota bacterium]MDE3050824.1 c-type cytochrome biogenesis protein CcmI [Nitrospirota bacterium]